MVYIIGTVKEAEKIKGKIPAEVYNTTLNIVTALDNTYGSERNPTADDGGVVVIGENVHDLAEIAERYFPIDRNTHEWVELIKCEREQYINILFLTNNEYGINIIIPLSIAPKILLNELEG